MGDGWCVDCGEEFHLDDTGGYNPPCYCGSWLCRNCCDCENLRGGEEYERDEDSYPDKGSAQS